MSGPGIQRLDSTTDLSGLLSRAGAGAREGRRDPVLPAPRLGNEWLDIWEPHHHWHFRRLVRKARRLSEVTEATGFTDGQVRQICAQLEIPLDFQPHYFRGDDGAGDPLCDGADIMDRIDGRAAIRAVHMGTERRNSAAESDRVRMLSESADRFMARRQVEQVLVRAEAMSPGTRSRALLDLRGMTGRMSPSQRMRLRALITAEAVFAQSRIRAGGSRLSAGVVRTIIEAAEVYYALEPGAVLSRLSRPSVVLARHAVIHAISAWFPDVGCKIVARYARCDPGTVRNALKRSRARYQPFIAWLEGSQ